MAVGRNADSVENPAFCVSPNVFYTLSTPKPDGMKGYLCLIAALLLYGCKNAETPISIGASNSFQFGAFENGESVGEGNFQTAISFQTGFRLRTNLDSITRDNFRTIAASRREGRSGFFNASFRYGIIQE
jgi:hypothetical protein